MKKTCILLGLFVSLTFSSFSTHSPLFKDIDDNYVVMHSGKQKGGASVDGLLLGVTYAYGLEILTSNSIDNFDSWIDISFLGNYLGLSAQYDLTDWFYINAELGQRTNNFLYTTWFGKYEDPNFGTFYYQDESQIKFTSLVMPIVAGVKTRGERFFLDCYFGYIPTQIISIKGPHYEGGAPDFNEPDLGFVEQFGRIGKYVKRFSFGRMSGYGFGLILDSGWRISGHLAFRRNDNIIANSVIFNDTRFKQNFIGSTIKVQMPL